MTQSAVKVSHDVAPRKVAFRVTLTVLPVKPRYVLGSPDRCEAIDTPSKSDGIKGFKMLIAAA